jgi:hypothetical protein
MYFVGRTRAIVLKTVVIVVFSVVMLVTVLYADRDSVASLVVENVFVYRNRSDRVPVIYCIQFDSAKLAAFSDDDTVDRWRSTETLIDE